LPAVPALWALVNKCSVTKLALQLAGIRHASPRSVTHPAGVIHDAASQHAKLLAHLTTHQLYTVNNPLLTCCCSARPSFAPFCCMCGQVKGLSSRKTLGQWLDERGVTAKPRLTLADQVQQHTGPGDSKKSRSSAAAAAQAAAHSAAANGGSASASGARVAEDLAAAAANAARLTAGGGHKAAANAALSGGGSWSSAALQVCAQVCGAVLVSGVVRL
jgi:hypothetical protein